MGLATDSRRRQRGAALLTALFLMLAVLMIGVSAARTALNGEKSARHERDRHIAFAAAEAALLDAEHDIEGGADAASARAARFAPGSSAGFTDSCGQGAASVNLGLCLPAPAASAPVWQALDLAEPGAGTVAYGQFTGAAMPAGSGLLPARLPRYLIELVPLVGAAPADGAFYRITAIGFGGRDTTRVVLQSYYHKPRPTPAGPQAAPTPAGPAIAPAAPPGTPEPGVTPDPTVPGLPSDPPAPVAPTAPAVPPASSVPAGRISWREIANWPELHQATLE
jgi:Tfp pilus assembly protein PilX